MMGLPDAYETVVAGRLPRSAEKMDYADPLLDADPESNDD